MAGPNGDEDHPIFTVRNANILDVRSGQESTGTNLTFESGSLSAVGNVHQESGVDELSINADEDWVMPGLVDVHLHPAPIANPTLNRRSDCNPTGRYGPIGPNQVHANLAETFRSGVMLVRDMGTPMGAHSDLRPYRERDIYPSVDSCVRPITGVDGHLSSIGIEVKSTREIRQAIETLSAADAAHVKVVNSPELADELLYDIVEIAQESGLNVSCHAYTNDAIEAAIHAGCNSIEHALPPSRDLARLAVTNDTTFVPTAYCCETTLLPEYLTDIDPSERSVFKKWHEQLQENAVFAIEEDVNIAIGTDAGMPPVGFSDFTKEAICLSRLGFSSDQILEAATLNGAELVDSPERSIIEEESDPNLVILKGDPRRDIRYLKTATPLSYKGTPMFDQLDEMLF